MESISEHFGLKMKQITFSLDQVNQILNALGEMPYKFAVNPIQLITSIAQPQLAEPAPQPTPQAEPAQGTN